MGESAHQPKGRKTQPVAHNIAQPVLHNIAAVKVDRARRNAAPRSNFIDELIKARKAEHRSVQNLAEMAGVATSAIKKLEAGEGSVATVVAVLEALPFQVAGLAPGRTFAEQLRNRRVKRAMSLDTVATKTSLPPQEIVELEQGEGSVQSLLRLLAVIAPTIRRRAPERAYWGSGDKADRDSRFTPLSFMEPIYEAFGALDLDPCAHRSSPVVARRGFFLAEGDDGLTQPWSGRFAFVNPPFSAQLEWVRRAHNQWKAGNVETIVCLVPARTDSAFFQDTVKAEADLYFLRGRVPFVNEAGKSQATPFSLMIVAFGATEQQRARFAARVPGFWVLANAHPTIAKCGKTVEVANYPHRNTGHLRYNGASHNCAADPRIARVVTSSRSSEWSAVSGTARA